MISLHRTSFLWNFFSWIIFPTLGIGDEIKKFEFGKKKLNSFFTLMVYTHADLFSLYLFVCLRIFPKSSAYRIPSNPRHEQNNNMGTLNVIV